MLNIDDYYLGIIKPHKSYYDKKNQYRYLGEESFDPFLELKDYEAMILGVKTLLHKSKNTYFDEYYSRYKNELFYHLEKINNIGIFLDFVRPFQDYYKEEPTIYIQEDIEDDYDQLLDILSHHSYYIAYSKLTRSDAIIILDEKPLAKFREDYFDHLRQKVLKKTK